jgi:hypothetical protein
MSAWIGPAIVAAFIGCLTTMLGWSVSYRQLRRLETSKRKEKIVDYQTALRAEIRSYRARFEQMDFKAYCDQVVALIKADPAYTPFVPLEAPQRIFIEIAKEIHILPTEVIEPIILFYAQTATVAQLTCDLRSEAFNRISGERKVQLLKDYYALLLHTCTLADKALERMDDAISNSA